MITIALVLLIAAASVEALVIDESTLFSIELAPAHLSSARSCDRTDDILGAPDGPVPITDSTLLLFSFRGYYLFDTTGTVVDSHVITPENFEQGYRVAYPIDDSTMLYYRPDTMAYPPVRILLKSFYKEDLREIAPDEYTQLSSVYLGRFLNIAHNTIFDRQTAKLFLEPHVVGYEELAGGARWWMLGDTPVLDSPLICRQADGSPAFFPGMFQCEGVQLPPDGTTTLRSVCEFQGRLRYLGSALPMSDTEEQHTTQRFFVCDNAGNVVFAHSALYGEYRGRRERETVRLGLLPVFNRHGHILYATVDQESCRLSVHRIRLPRYFSQRVSAPPAKAYMQEEDVAYEPRPIMCTQAQNSSPEIPHVTFTGPDGERRVARARDLEHNGFVARIARVNRRDVLAKVSRPETDLPDEPKRLCDSIVSLGVSGCPYVLSLSGPDGYLRTFAYPSDQTVLCARVIGLAPDRTVGVRVDLTDYAEVLLFDEYGVFVNRFVFNNQPFESRKDLVAMRRDGALFEKDYELDAQNPDHYIWMPDIREEVTDW
ncbi:MAG: hypothetical protein GF331_22450 [Chitinivibrionales bacterium]|nr:hypothetical protein [Chitinivibrionales bacterium]